MNLCQRDLTGRGARRPATPHRGDTVARAGDRRGSVARRAARDGSEARALQDPRGLKKLGLTGRTG